MGGVGKRREGIQCALGPILTVSFCHNLLQYVHGDEGLRELTLYTEEHTYMLLFVPIVHAYMQIYIVSCSIYQE